MIKKVIKTKLVQKDEVFKILALGEATGFPVLLKGVPGTAKTNCMIDYIANEYSSIEEAKNHVFLLETDELTKPSEVKGQVDLKSLFVDKKWDKLRPIAKAKYVMINEVDKANSGCRNAFLSIMNEKRIFDGEETIPCEWKLFVATCNEIPQEETNNPFWDRFAIKYTVSRADIANLMNFVYKNEITTIELDIPEKVDLDNIKLTEAKLRKFLELGQKYLSDRSLTRVAPLVKATMVVYKCDENAALLKVAQLLCQAIITELSNAIEDKDVIALRSELDRLSKCNDINLASSILNTIEFRQNVVINKSTIKVTDKKAIIAMVENAIKNSNSVVKEAFNNMQALKSDISDVEVITDDVKVEVSEPEEELPF